MPGPAGDDRDLLGRVLGLPPAVQVAGVSTIQTVLAFGVLLVHVPGREDRGRHLLLRL